MKKHALFYLASLISITTTVVCLGADDTLPNSATATVTTPTAAPAATVGAQAPALPYGVSEVVKMYQGGINKDVLVSYIENTVLPFHLNADGIIYLQHLGMPQEVTSALIRRDGELQKQAAATYQQQSIQQQQAAQAAANNPVVAGNTAPPMVMPSTPPPVVPYAYPDAASQVVYPDYTAYPYYGYPYYYGPSFVIGGGWGWGWGGHGWVGRGGFGPGGFGRGGFGGRGGFSGGRGGFSGGHGGFGGHH